MLLAIENLFTTEETAAIRHSLAQGVWQDGTTTAGDIARNVKQNLQLDHNSDIAKQLQALIVERLQQHPTFISAALPARFFPPRFNCYQNGGFYGLHVDNAIMGLGTAEQIRTDVSATLFLNSPDAYEGGELQIETRYGLQSVKLPEGDLIVYPSTSLHQVTPVTSGQRLASFMWMQSLVKDPAEREMLFEMDQSIQTLGAKLGTDHDEVARLGQLYHNLLRKWSE